MRLSPQGEQLRTNSSQTPQPPVQFLDPEGHLLVERPPLGDERVMEAYRAMLLGRRFDELCVKLQRRGLMVTFAPGIGQEACAVGSAMALDKHRDWFVPQYREVAGQFVHGFSVRQAFLWHVGSPLGFQTPKGLLMLPSNAGVSGQIPHAVGLAWGLKLQGKTDVALVHFGDGGTSQGDFHESANLAGVMKAPVIFFCQNNRWAISTPRERQTASETIAQKAYGYGFPGVRVDGNDLFAVYEETRQAVERARAGEGPSLIEGETFRLGMHTTADTTRYDSPEVFEQWQKRDPLLRVQRYLERRGLFSADIGARMEREIEVDLETTWKEVQELTPARIGESLDHVFSEMPPRLRDQRIEMSEENHEE